jgi:hypothetical protein
MEDEGLRRRFRWKAFDESVCRYRWGPKVLSCSYSALHLHFTSTQNVNDVAESEYQNLLSRWLRLVGRLGLLRELCSRAHLRVVSNEAARNPHAPAIFTPTNLRRLQSSHTPRPGSDDSSHRLFVQQVAILIGSGGDEIVYGLLPSRRPL